MNLAHAIRHSIDAPTIWGENEGEEMTDELQAQADAQRLQDQLTEARWYFRRGYSWIDCLGAVGLDPYSPEFAFDLHVTENDEKAHDNSWLNVRL